MYQGVGVDAESVPALHRHMDHAPADTARSAARVRRCGTAAAEPRGQHLQDAVREPATHRAHTRRGGRLHFSLYYCTFLKSILRHQQ